MVKLEDVLTEEEIAKVCGWHYTIQSDTDNIRACIALAVEKAEKVSGFVHWEVPTGKQHEGGIYLSKSATGWIDPPRHALLLLGPRYEPKKTCPTCGTECKGGFAEVKPVKSAEERIKEALAAHDKECKCLTRIDGRRFVRCEMARILRGDGEGR